MVNSAQQHINQITNKQYLSYLDISNRDLSGNMNLKEFVNLKYLNSSNNKFTNLNFLNTLPNKEKLEKINFFGNEIKQVDFSVLLKNFPNIKEINLQNNPLGGNDLGQLNSQQFSQLIKLVEEKKIKINSWRGNFLLDLLRYTEQLKKENETLKQKAQSDEKLVARQLQENSRF